MTARRPPTPALQCTRCCRPFRPRSKTPFCGRCRRLFMCHVCSKIDPDGRIGSWCRECKFWYARIRVLMASLGPTRRPEPAELEIRLAYYSFRAKETLPLFDDLHRDLLSW